MRFHENFVKLLRIPFHIEHLWWLLLNITVKNLFIDSVNKLKAETQTLR